MTSIYQVFPKPLTEFSHEKPLFLNVYFISVLIRFNYLIKKAKKKFCHKCIWELPQPSLDKQTTLQVEAEVESSK